MNHYFVESICVLRRIALRRIQRKQGLIRMNYLIDKSGAKWSIRRTSLGDKVYQCGTTRAYSLQLLDAKSATLPSVIGFYASSTDEAKARLGILA